MFPIALGPVGPWLRWAGRLLLPAIAAALAAAPPAWGQSRAAPASSPAEANAGKQLIAVLDLKPVGATDVQASAVTDRLREELLKTKRFTLVDRSQMQAVLNEQALQQTGCTEQECAVQVGRILGVRKIVAGKVTKISDTQWQISAIVVDVETSETTEAESIQYQGPFFGLLSTQVPPLVAKLTGETPAVAAQLAPTPVVAPQASAPGAERSRWPWITGWALVGAAGLLQANALNLKSQAQDKANQSRTQDDRARWEDAHTFYDLAVTRQREAVVLIAGGAVLLWYAHSRSSATAARESERSGPLFAFDSQGLRAGWHWRW
jgi:Curli production assembly/transport component CsgG